MNCEIFSSGYRVLTSGSVMSFDYSSDVVISYSSEEEDGIIINIHLIFKEDNNSESKVSSRIEGDDVFLDCLNFRGVFGVGIGIVDPLLVREQNGKKVFFRYWASDLGTRVSRRIDYSLYMEK